MNSWEPRYFASFNNVHTGLSAPTSEHESDPGETDSDDDEEA